ncbi:MAG: SDR family oxidoreductase [Pirellulaceae bacterium]|nr:SDR family oxidoreductase [Pirellulaceae bacterium]MDP6558360.1 SDR family oxidoreductase [Pirellulaceae bacterium]MDP6720855.1 SDR family oxidoreductase [Pirellulaceae bacterium]
MIDLAGHAVLVTGSTKGVGRSIAVAMAAAGADVVIHGRAEGQASREVLSACQDKGVRAEFVTGDLSGPTDAAVERMFEQAQAALPEIDILVNNAGTYDDVPYLEMDLPRFERTMRLNVFAPFFLTQRFARHWVRQRVNGRVLMIGSINGRMAEPTHSGYDTSKGAVETMVKTLCVELAPQNIRVNGLAPGLVVTPLTSIIEEDPNFKRWMCLHTPNGEVPGSEVVGDGAVYLCSDAARHVHGQMLLVDGGMSIWQQPDMPLGWK